MTTTKYTAAKVQQLAAEHSGEVVAHDDAETQFRIVFPNYARAASFHGDMVSLFLDESVIETVPGDRCALVLTPSA